ncbi:MAG TPA: hypothetical protein PLD25_11940 [Chloroflexota bacterium]|nr:hypothetical protein [Chloroflexota bacterium]HUM71796.1 hypothetical protein [Chloroflexota bacterium]
MFTNNYVKLIWRLAIPLMALLLLAACSSTGLTNTAPDPTTSAPVATAEPAATMAATAVPATNGSPQISLDTGSVATGFQTETVAAVSEAEGGPYWGVMPEYSLLTLPGYPISSHLMTPQIFIYPVADLQAVNEGTVPIVTSLQTLLQSPQEISPMPFLPLLNAQQVIHTHVQYLDFQDGQGVRYLTQFDQAFIPINNYELIYTYQGLTSDGKYYVAAMLPVNHPSLPPDGNVTGNEPPEFTDDFPTYLANVVASLNPQAADTFNPDLTQLDAMMSSLEIK